MKSIIKFISGLFNGRITFGKDVRNFVNVLNSCKNKESDELMSGFIREVDFKNRTLTVEESEFINSGNILTHVIKFNDIVTISRMRDLRLRMWIKMEE